MLITKNVLLTSYSSMKKNQLATTPFSKFGNFIWLQLIFSQKTFLILYPTLENSTTGITNYHNM